MMTGVTKGYLYKMRFCYAHFPINVSITGRVVEIRNFLGEKRVRRVELAPGVDYVRTADVKDQIELSGIDIAAVSMTGTNSFISLPRSRGRISVSSSTVSTLAKSLTLIRERNKPAAGQPRMSPGKGEASAVRERAAWRVLVCKISIRSDSSFSHPATEECSFCVGLRTAGVRRCDRADVFLSLVWPFSVSLVVIHSKLHSLLLLGRVPVPICGALLRFVLARLEVFPGFF
ncbi:unnamed protein product [Sphacelaria rigidula]